MHALVRTSLVATIATCTAACSLHGCALSTGGTYYTYAATATVQVLPPVSESDGAPAEPYDVWLATEMERMKMPEFIDEAVHDARLSQVPAFQGRNDASITQSIVGHVELQRHSGTSLLDITVSGPNAAWVAPCANALAKELHDTLRARGKAKHDEQKAMLEADRDRHDSMIRLLTIDRTSSIKGIGLTETALQDAWELGARRRAEYALQIDVVSRRLIEAEAQNADPDARKALAKTRDGYTTELERLQAEAERLASIKSRVEALDREIAHRRDEQSTANQQLDEMESQRSSESDSVRVESAAKEPTQPR